MGENKLAGVRDDGDLVSLKDLQTTSLILTTTAHLQSDFVLLMHKLARTP